MTVKTIIRNAILILSNPTLLEFMFIVSRKEFLCQFGLYQTRCCDSRIGKR